LIGLTVI
jgi:hypothetical protein